jgi:hypothetical protein
MSDSIRADLATLTDRLVALEANVAQVLNFIGQTGSSPPAESPRPAPRPTTRRSHKSKPSKRSKPKKRPAPLLDPFIVYCRAHSWSTLEIEGLQVGEKITKSGVAERQHVNLRELVRYFSHRGQQPGSDAEGTIVKALHRETMRLRKKLAELNRSSEEPIEIDSQRESRPA